MWSMIVTKQFKQKLEKEFQVLSSFVILKVGKYYMANEFF